MTDDDSLKIIIGSVIAIVVGLVATITIIGDTTGDVNTAGSSFNDTALCQAEGCVYNLTASSTLPCRNDSIGAGVCSAGQPTVPLNGLFNTNGVVTLVFIAAALIAILVMILGK